MFERLARRSDEVWAGHSPLFEDLTHVIGGMGIGLLLCSTLRTSNRSFGFALIAVSAALHVYAFATARRPIGVFMG